MAVVTTTDFGKAKSNITNPNPSGIAPFEFKVVVLPDDAEAETLKQYGALAKSGFKLAEEAKERYDYAAQTGRLIAISPVAFTYETWPEGTRLPQTGDHVAFAKYAGFRMKGKDGIEYRVINDKDVAAVLDF
jgi:co-chaperonin GroES (HSP10)